MDSSISPKDEIWFLRVCQHIQTQSTAQPLEMAKICWPEMSVTNCQPTPRNARKERNFYITFYQIKVKVDDPAIKIFLYA